jgi:hypothetical protein
MGDADDAAAVAVVAQRKLAAGRLVRKEELEAELVKLRSDRAAVDAAAPGPEGDALRGEVDARIAAASAELATVAAEHKAALAEIEALKRLARTAKAPPVSGAAEDPLIDSPVDAALANARAHIRDLDAQARVGDELRPAPPAPASPAPARADADAAAKATFEELRAKKSAPAAPPAPGEPPVPPKKSI